MKPYSRWAAARGACALPRDSDRSERGDCLKPTADFRADINGLRAVAVLAVVLFHFGVAGFSGGFVGVDVFFVISGYLMTRLILGPLAEARFSVLRFYLARARRIFPALAVLGALMLAYGWYAMSPMDYKLLTKHVGASLLFLSNQVYWKESGYFDADAHEKWLLHTWSLSVEWQFYLLYPLLIVAAHRIFRRPAGISGALWVVFLTSLAWSAWLAFANPSKAFFLLPTRAWEMLAGGLIFIHQDACARHLRGWRWIEAIGIAVILLAGMLLNPASTWPGLNALIPVVGTMLVLANGASNASFLSNIALQGIGRWSYSIYLWHWPIVVWLYQSQFRQDGVWIAAGMAASIALGWISFRLVEVPARSFVNRFSLAPALAACTAMMAAPFAAAAAFHFMNDQLTWLRFKDHPRLAEAKALADYEAFFTNGGYKPLYRVDTCLLSQAMGPEAFAKDCAGREPHIVLWGDSHAAHLWPGLKALTSIDSVAQWTATGCPPLMQVELPKLRHCRAINDWVFASIMKSRPQVVILAAAWFRHDEETIRRGLAETLSRFDAEAAWRPRIVVIGSVPIWHRTLPRLLASDLLAGNSSEHSPSGLDRSAFRQDELVRRLVGIKAEFFSPIAAVCNANGCLRYFTKENAIIPFAYDYGHLAEASSQMVAEHLLRQLGEIDSPPPLSRIPASRNQ